MDYITSSKSIYIGINNKAKRVSKIYVGDSNNKASLFWEAPAKSMKLPWTDGITSNEEWWASLKNSLWDSTTEERAACVGLKVYVTLNSEVLGTTGHYVRCIGYDCDGEKSLTFQTMNTLATYTKFSNSNALWIDDTIDSEARTKCHEYYNAFPGKASITPVQKRYFANRIKNSKNQKVDRWFTEDCFLISSGEIGWTNSETTACSNVEFGVGNVNNSAYQYFTGADRRGKYKGTDNDPQGQTSDLTGYLWLRSRVYNNANYVCRVYDNGTPSVNTYGANGGLSPAFVIDPGSPWIGWGLADEDADATWWANLRTWVLTVDEVDLAACVGMVKKVTLSSTVLGTTTHYVRCVGYNCDGEHTLTFQTMNTLANTVSFGSNAIWYDGSTNSNARAECINYYNAFPGKDSIKTVSKKYCSLQNSSQTNNSDKTYGETVFLPSDAEMGHIAGGPGKGYASAYDEFCTANTAQKPYQYYTQVSKRLKYKSTDNDPNGFTSEGSTYWTRSRLYSYEGNVCIISYDGTPYSSHYNDSYSGIAPTFVIG